MGGTETGSVKATTPASAMHSLASIELPGPELGSGPLFWRPVLRTLRNIPGWLPTAAPIVQLKK